MTMLYNIIMLFHRPSSPVDPQGNFNTRKAVLRTCHKRIRSVVRLDWLLCHARRRCLLSSYSSTVCQELIYIKYIYICVWVCVYTLYTMDCRLNLLMWRYRLNRRKYNQKATLCTGRFFYHKSLDVNPVRLNWEYWESYVNNVIIFYRFSTVQTVL